MGCTSSSVNNTKNQSHNQDTVVLKANPLSESEIQARIESSPTTLNMDLGGIKLRYAWVSQRGYYPESPDKDNQDACISMPMFGNPADQQAFFAIFDGHGRDGHYCSRFAKDNLYKNILDKYYKIPPGGVNFKSLKEALTLAHSVTNESMHTDKRFDDSLSGTTAISILFRGKTMYVSNVGDSRAIVVSKGEDGRLVAKALSSDQTPYRKDERERIKKYGARILTMDQLEGVEPIHENWGDLNLGEDIDEGGDPPRVWSPNGSYPGTAFTRSLGDVLAEECGVIAEPEILERDINPNDKFVVIASDGVFEFLTNQMVADMLSRYEDPLEACKAIVSESYNMWLQFEVRTDDISIIAFYIDDMPKANFNAKSSFFASDSGKIISSTTAVPPSINDLEARPVRRVISKEKRKNMIQLKSDEDDDDLDDETLTTDSQILLPKSEDEQQVIRNAMKTNFLFQHLNESQRAAVINVMKPVSVKRGDLIIRQGDPGDKFYIVDMGKFEVRVRMPNTTAPPSVDERSTADSFDDVPDTDKDTLLGGVVHVYESNAELHPGFGELSLMYGKPRAASVLALTEGKLWSLDRKVFRKVVLRPKDIRRLIIRCLKRVELFKCLNITQLQRLADLLNEKSYSTGDAIITQGEPGFTFYIIVSGKCDCTINSTDGTPAKVVMSLKDYDYFGERALLESKPRAANVIALAPTKVLYIDKAAFEEVLGPLAEIIDEDRAHREALAQAKLALPQTYEDLSLKGIVSADALGPLLLGSFKSDIVNLTVRSFVLSDIAKNSMSDSVNRYLEAAKLTQIKTISPTPLIPNCMSIVRQPNALHLVFNSVIVGDLGSFIRSRGQDFVGNTDYLIFCFACIVSALEYLHSANIVYRAIQPESIYVDNQGRVVLMDFRFCKLGLYGTNKAFTICGATDYLSPEQISQTGHSFPVDFWGLGVLLYELATGNHPFSSQTEVATYSKITSFGTKVFPTLKFPEAVSSDTKALINQLLVPTPEARIGAGTNGFSALKKHSFFKTFEKWDDLENNAEASPVCHLAKLELQDILDEPIEKQITDSFTQSFDGTFEWLKNIEA